jgi:HD-GYP domain-containing protein (c-di-GMP phosphodiesterase class II)
MILVPVSELVEGMFCAQEIRTRNNMVLIARGAKLTEAAVRILQASGIEMIYVEQEGTEDIRAAEVLPSEERVRYERVVGKALKNFQRQVDSRRIDFDTQAFARVATDLVDQLMTNGEAIIPILEGQQRNERFWQHLVNSAIMATLLAQNLGHTEEACQQLALGMLFHDCGQLFLPQEVFEKTDALSEEDWKIIRKHPRVGFEQVMHLKDFPSVSANIILRHHERLDGKGYPDGISGSELHPLARIAAVVEAFDAMTSLRAYGRAMSPDQAMRALLAETNTAFDRQVVMTLIQHVAMYPPGTAVRLNTGECGLVVENTPGAMTRPKVRLYFGAEGERLSMVDVDLAKDSNRSIVQWGVSLTAIRDRAA